MDIVSILMTENRKPVDHIDQSFHVDVELKGNLWNPTKKALGSNFSQFHTSQQKKKTALKKKKNHFKIVPPTGPV